MVVCGSNHIIGIINIFAFVVFSFDPEHPGFLHIQKLPVDFRCNDCEMVGKRNQCADASLGDRSGTDYDDLFLI